ncbi:MAG TPA: hypothetical protein VF285_03480 [Castellaniella sp.]|uniref:hypothetical protein n=1 Tax=Castellaniella sp. TaxID=1955812 RepID=UPI002EF93C4A
MTRNLHISHLQLALLASALMLGGALISGSAFAATPAGTAQDNMAVQTEAGVSYLNGGIGAGEQDQMHRDAHNWPLHMTFSEGKAGAFVADAHVKVMNKAGKTVFDVTGAGPLTYVKLSPGAYKVTAEHNGKTLTRDVHVGKKASDLYFRW